MFTSDVTGPRNISASQSDGEMTKSHILIYFKKLNILTVVNKYLYQEILSLVTGLFMY